MSDEIKDVLDDLRMAAKIKEQLKLDTMVVHDPFAMVLLSIVCSLPLSVIADVVEDAMTFVEETNRAGGRLQDKLLVLRHNSKE